MEYNTWKAPDGQWKGQAVSSVVKGSTREEVIGKLKNMIDQNPELYDICSNCDPQKFPLCNKCLGC